MTWTAPEPPAAVDGPQTGPERAVLQGFLDDQRRTLHALCAGLTGEQLAVRAVPPSTLTLLGLVRHLTKVERIWFRRRVAGLDVPMVYGDADGKDTDFLDLDPADAEQVLLAHAEECRLSDEAVAAVDLDETFVLHGQAHSLRLVLVHVVAEYARHAGHADLLREQVDGRTGI